MVRPSWVMKESTLVSLKKRQLSHSDRWSMKMLAISLASPETVKVPTHLLLHSPSEVSFTRIIWNIFYFNLFGSHSATWMDSQTCISTESERRFRCSHRVHRHWRTEAFGYTLERGRYDTCCSLAASLNLLLISLSGSRWTSVSLQGGNILTQLPTSATGNYKCQADNGLSRPIEAFFYISVLGMLSVDSFFLRSHLFYPPLGPTPRFHSKWGAFRTTRWLSILSAIACEPPCCSRCSPLPFFWVFWSPSSPLSEYLPVSISPSNRLV